MKKILSCVVVALCLLASCGTSQSSLGNKSKAAADTLRILAIGNSFSADAVEQELYGLFAAAGQPVVIGDMYIGGCTLEKHWKQASTDTASYSYRKIVGGKRTVTKGVKLSDALKDEPWDYISLQQGGGFHGMRKHMEPYLTKMIGYVREHAGKGFKLIYHVPWAAQKGCTSKKFSYYGNDQQAMYDSIVATTKWVTANHQFDVVINTFDAIQNGRTSFLGDTFNRDGWHLNKTFGRYTAGCIWFEKIMGKSVVGNSYHPASITERVARTCQKAAHYACRHPYRITKL